MTQDVGSVIDGLVEIARRIHPAILSQGGLAAALKGLVRRSAVPVALDACIDVKVPDEVEVAAYYVAAEALTNVAKHARASVAHMDVTTDDGTLTLMVRDDGVGGADAGKGSGLVGLHDRVEAPGGTITIDSSVGSGTCVVVTLPIATEPDREIESLSARRTSWGRPRVRREQTTLTLFSRRGSGSNGAPLRRPISWLPTLPLRRRPTGAGKILFERMSISSCERTYRWTVSSIRG